MTSEERLIILGIECSLYRFGLCSKYGTIKKQTNWRGENYYYVDHVAEFYNEMYDYWGNNTRIT